MFVFISLNVTHWCVSRAAVTEMSPGQSRFEAMLPPPRLGQLLYDVDWHGGLDLSGKVAAGMVWVWVFLLVASLAAFAISFHMQANTWIYLLLRRSIDGAAFDQIAEAPRATEPVADQVGSTPDA